MRKILKNINKNKKFIFCLIVIISLIGIFMQVNSGVYAQTNRNYYDPDNPLDEIATTIQALLSEGLGNAGGVLMMPISLIITVVNILLFLVMYLLFVSTGVADGFAFPFPDQIIFNGIPMLDPNFINPNNVSTSIVNIMSSIVQKLYYSFFSLAGTVFVLAAVIIGIKLAFSSLASEKAQYKDAIKHWIVGLALLFLMHIVLTGMFAINEKICEAASNLCNKVSIEVIDFFSAIGGKGGTQVRSYISSIVASFDKDAASKIEDIGVIKVPGYGGVLLKFAVHGILKQDIIYSIGLAIMLGQTFSLIIMYLKRVFYCIILGMIAPVVVAVDTIQKVVTGRDKGIFMAWFKNISAIIFTQSFQAIFMCVVVIVIGEVSKSEANTDLIEAIISVVALNAIMKFDKLFKEILGINDSKILGGLNENAMKSFAAIKSGMDLAKRSAEPFKKRADAKARLAEATKRRDKLLADLTASNARGGNASNTTVQNNNNNNNQNSDSGSPDQNSNSSNQGQVSNEQVVTALNNLTAALNTNTSAKEDEKHQKLTDELAKAEADVRKARADQRAESLRAFTRFGTTLGAVGFGIGATDNLGDAVTVGNIVDMPMDAMTDRSINRGVYGNTSRKYGTTKSRDAFIRKYMENGGLSREAAEKAAEKSMSNIQSQLNKEIPETIAHMVGDVTKEAALGAADIISREGRKHSRKVRKELYSSSRIDDI